MPKETVRSAYAGGREMNEPEVRVGWSRETGHVQLGTVMDDEAVLQPTPEGNGWFVTLDRAGINALVRHLRRARDQAYGRDE